MKLNQNMKIMNFKTFTTPKTYWAALLVLVGVFSQAIAQSRITAGISIATDDYEERLDGSFDVGSSDLEMPFESYGTASSKQLIGLRFTNVALPKGAVITNAYIQFKADEPNIEPTSLTIRGIDDVNPGTFTLTDKISTRALVGDSVVWANIPAWAEGDYGVNQRTPNLKNLVQAIIDKAAWAKGNAMGFVITGKEGKRVAEAFDKGGAPIPAQLVIDYLVPVSFEFRIKQKYDDLEEWLAGTAASSSRNVGWLDSNSTDLELGFERTTSPAGGTRDPQMIGLRFNKINLPKGAPIFNAYIQFTNDDIAKDFNPSNLVVKTDSLINPSPFALEISTLTKRIKSRDSIQFTMAPFTVLLERGVKQRTADLTSLIAPKINSNSWVSGNALAFYITGSGIKEVESYDGALIDHQDTTRIPTLVIESLGNDPTVAVVKPKYQVGTFPVKKGASWKYNDAGTDLSGTTWTAKKYADDANWAFGNAKVGYKVSSLGTAFDTLNKRTTYYLRNTFTANDLGQFDSLVVFAHVNDGAVFYINGTEVKRVNMPNGAVNYATLASSEISGAGVARYTRFVIPNTFTSNDTNSIAVELHGASAAAVDLSFDFEISGKLPKPQATNFPITKSSVWSAFDQGKDLGTAWKNLNYEVGNWVHGPGVLGYGDPVATLLSFGDESNNKYPTTYFRKQFNIVNLADLSADSVALNMRVDDAAVVFINGTEVKRVNFSKDSVITYKTYSGRGPASETTYYPYKVAKSVFVQGLNVIAVEVHQDDQFSSDVTFDLELKNIPAAPTVARGCTGPNDTHISCFTSVAPSTKNQVLNVPETHITQNLVQAGYTYNKGTGVVGTNNDFTGFVPDNMTSSTKGHLSINHETAVGAVSMLDISFNSTTKLWAVDSAQGIDFTVVQGTTRNCSGTVTPWGTVITCEETRGSADANVDGYRDFGWAVEIDPKTNKIPQYGTGKAQKLWAVGNASHENVVVAQDSITLYWGEDAGDAHIYKFVADQKMNMYAGKLYALKLDNNQIVSTEATTSTGTWVLVPNTTQSDRNTSYSLAKALGATQFNGIEDVEIGSIDKKIYFTAKGNNRVYRFKDNGANGVSEFETFVGGDSYSFVTKTAATTEAWGSGNDNLTFDDRGNMYVLQDGSQDHIWMVRPDHTQNNPKVELFATTPEGSEPTGMTFSPDFKFMFISMQEPAGTNTAVLKDAASKDIVFNKSTTLVIARKENLGGVTSIAPEAIEAAGQFVIYPNPTEGQVNIKFNLLAAGVVKVEVLDAAGKVVYASNAQELLAGDNTATFSLNTSGLYIVRLTTPAGISTQKVLVK